MLSSAWIAAALISASALPGEYFATYPVWLEPATDAIAVQGRGIVSVAAKLASDTGLNSTRIFGDRALIEGPSVASDSQLLQQLLGEPGITRLATYRDPAGALLIADGLIRARFAKGINTASVGALTRELGAISARSVRPSLGLWEITAPSPEDTLEVAARLHFSGATLWAHPDFIHRKARHAIPDDPRFPDQWHHDIIGTAAAWDIEPGSSDIIIAIIDSGVDLTHPDLAGRLVSPRDTLDLDDDPSPEPTPDDPYDADGAHGTATAGLAAAIPNNTLGVAGVCGGCSIMPIRIMGESGFGRYSADSDAFYWAADHGAHILSNSWGFEQPVSTPPNLSTAILYAAEQARDNKGTVILFASGNDSWENASYEVASNPLVMSIGATDYYDDREPYSNWGADLDIVAPAASVTTDISGATGYSSGDYVTGFGGTSAATPVVAGVAGLILSIDSELTRGQVQSILIDSADKIGGVVYDANGFHPEYGYGRVNALRAVQLASGGNVCQPVLEDCDNGIDDDCDGLIDDLDTTCAPTTTTVGGGCTQDYQCGIDGTCFTAAQGYEGGYCTSYCNTSAECPGDGVCVPARWGSFCVDGCTDITDCRDGYDCVTVSTGDLACLPSCTVQGCVEGETCNEVTGDCTHDGPIQPAGPCTDNLECALDGRCFTFWLNGFCRVSCTANKDCGDTGQVCENLFGYTNACLDSCVSNNDCRWGWACRPDGVCFPACTSDDDCDPSVCNGYGLCGLDTPPEPEPPEIDCLYNADCGADGACKPRGDDTGYCVRECRWDADCQPNTICNGYGLCGFDMPPITGDPPTGGTGGAGGSGGAGGVGGVGGGDGGGGSGGSSITGMTPDDLGTAAGGGCSAYGLPPAVGWPALVVTLWSLRRRRRSLRP